MKGISPIVASVLLIVMVVAISAFLVSSVTTLTKEATAKAENKTQESTNCAGASIKIEDVYIANGTAGTARVQVRNDGLNDGLSIVSGQLLNTTGNNFTADGLPIVTNRGSIVMLTFSNISMQNCTTFSKVTVTTNCAGAYDIFTRSPKC